MKLWSLAGLVALALGATAVAQPAPVTAPALDKLFNRAGAATPGCAVGVEAKGSAPVLRAYGQADLEHGVPNTPETIFEAGSVSKQFTAAATLLLVKDGKLSLGDDAHIYLPELPDYGRPITIAELLGHTSGLRDWGSVEAMAGWPRGDRVYSLADVLRIASRQRVLNYAPGQRWSYTNTGYNLLALIVQRVSGRSLADFTRERLFVPLGMTHTSWRDDFRRVVPGRAVAYARETPGGAYEQLMPFEDAYGNGGLLTTVGDLLIWNRALGEHKLGDFVAGELERRTVLTDGHPVDYARGLFIQSHHGMREVSHSGATAGYRAWLGRFPDQGLSVAVLCNGADALGRTLPYDVADLYLPPGPPAAALTPAPASFAGWYASDRDGAPMHLALHDGQVETDRGVRLMLDASGGFTLALRDGASTGQGQVLPDGRLALDVTGDRTVFTRAETYAPAPAALAAIAGRYHSAEADATYRVTVDQEGLKLTVEERSGQTQVLKPAYDGAFADAETTLRPVHGTDGAVIAIRLSDDRAWDVRFDRVP